MKVDQRRRPLSAASGVDTFVAGSAIFGSGRLPPRRSAEMKRADRGLTGSVHGHRGYDIAQRPSGAVRVVEREAGHETDPLQVRLDHQLGVEPCCPRSRPSRTANRRAPSTPSTWMLITGQQVTFLHPLQETEMGIPMAADDQVSQAVDRGPCMPMITGPKARFPSGFPSSTTWQDPVRTARDVEQSARRRAVYPPMARVWTGS